MADLKLRDVKKIIDSLHEKLSYVKWYNEERKEKLEYLVRKLIKGLRKG